MDFAVRLERLVAGVRVDFAVDHGSHLRAVVGLAATRRKTRLTGFPGKEVSAPVVVGAVP